MASVLVVYVIIVICVSRVSCLRPQRTSSISVYSPGNSMVSRDANLTTKHRSLRLIQLYSNSFSGVIAKSEEKNGIYRLLSAISDSHVIMFNVLSLSALVIQNSGLTITMRLSRIGKPASELYRTSTAVALSELMKLVISAVVYFCVERNDLSIRQMLRRIYSDNGTLLKTSIPSTLYVLQNNLQYLATSNLPAEIYQVLIQMKLITTALLSSSVLKRKLSNAQWMSIVMLFVGVAIVQLSLQTSSTITNFNPVVGIAAVLVSCVTSGFAGVYNEKLLKDDSTSLWARNVQLSTISFLLSMCTCVADRVSIFERGFFHGYNPLVLSVILLQALGGIIVSIVVKNTGSIVKGFATSGSIVLSCIFSIFLFNDITMNAQFLAGTLLVVLSTFAYSYFSSRVASTQ